VTLWHGDCRLVLADLPDESVDAVVTDPPYELGFMGRRWDATGIAYEVALWRDVLRVLKPGGHLLAFGGTRTWHRLACAIEDAGFEVRDSIAWMYGSGFPKSLDVSKAIDKAAGAEREVVGAQSLPGDQLQRMSGSAASEDNKWTGIKYGDAVTPLAQKWQGWGTALKPAFEPVVVARKPLIGTVAANVQEYGTGALNIDGGRVGTEENLGRLNHSTSTFNHKNTTPLVDNSGGLGRWPANVILDESQARELDRHSGVTSSKSGGVAGWQDEYVGGTYKPIERTGHDDTGGASRFFYTAKADSSERPRVDGVAHPTVKPLDLMRYLVRLVTPPGGVVLEPFAGSGTTLEACIVEGFACIGIEREADYIPLIMARITKPIEPVLW
jgi:hypothetical protein